MSIDSAVYVSTKTDVHKFLSGAPESFSPTFPNENPQFDGIYTSADDEQVYVLDTAQASVYALTKEGNIKGHFSQAYLRKRSGSIFLKEPYTSFPAVRSSVYHLISLYNGYLWKKMNGF
ncbi:hypothetical protein IPM65_01070 [Candidatus Roizmanbacteria bacterium]|nr:MAG: hypothetical protein IPM65_01070 [Candidatus Roizmanbacteria bacterium]